MPQNQNYIINQGKIDDQVPEIDSKQKISKQLQKINKDEDIAKNND